MSDVLNRTTKQYLKSINTPDYSEIDWIINPDISGLESIPTKYWKITGDIVTEMSQEEKDYVDAHTATILLENYKIDEYSTDDLLLTISYYQDKNNEVYSKLAKQITYTYITNTPNLKQIDIIIYNSLAEITYHKITKFYTDPETNKIITETEVI